MSGGVEVIPVQDAHPPFYVGIDLGGTNIKIGVVDDLGRVLYRVKIPTETENGPEDGARRMGQTALEAIAHLGLKPTDVRAVGLGSPGSMDIPAGMLLEPHNLPGWYNFPIRDRVSHYCGMPVSFANDANAAAYGEFWVGCGADFNSLVLLTLGTGVGGGIIVDHQSIDGEHSHGSECGHVVIDCRDDARICPCGRPGHLEAYASGTAVVERTQEALAHDKTSSLHRRLANGEELTPLMLAQEAEAGDEFSYGIIMETARYLGAGVVSVAHMIDPDVVVLGGGMTFGGHKSPLGRQFLQRVKEEMHRLAFPVVAEKVAVDFATLGNDAGYIGAAGIARRKTMKN